MLKENFLSRITLLLMVSSMGQAALDPRVKDILDKYLLSVQLPNLVYPNTTSCQGFWMAKGLACDEVLLTSYANKHSADIQLAEEELYKMFDTVQASYFFMSSDIKKYTGETFFDMMAYSMSQEYKLG